MKKILRSIPVAMGDSISVQLDYEDGTKRVVKYARFLMETKIGRELTMHDIVIHKDGDTLNFNLDNLVLTTKLEQTRSKHAARYSVDTLDSRIQALIERRDNRTTRKAKIEVTPKAITKKPPLMAAFICGECAKPAQRRKTDLAASQRKGKLSFCSLSCSGKHLYRTNPVVQAGLQARTTELRLQAQAKQIEAQLAALKPTNGKLQAVA